MTDKSLDEEEKLHKAVFDKWLSEFMEDTKQALNYTVNINKNKEHGMKVKTYITDAFSLANEINRIGWENVLQILPKHDYNGTSYVIIYKENKDVERTNN